MLARITCLAAALLSTSALSADNEITAGVATLSYSSYSRGSLGRYSYELGYLRNLRWGRLPFQAGGGLRTATPFAGATVPLELFARARLVARIGPWEPAAGPQLGFSGFANLEPPPALPLDRFVDEAQRVSALYLAFDGAPLRFRLFQHLTVSTMEVQVGTTLIPAGAALRLQLGLLQIGGTL